MEKLWGVYGLQSLWPEWPSPGFPRAHQDSQ
jgi:hypothetical protein